jgi:hypothetical protein
MKIRIMLLTFCLLALTPTLFAQNTINLFQPTPVTQSPPSTVSQPFTYGTEQVRLTCPTDGTAFARLTGEDSGGLIADNYITINGTNICPDGNCFVRTATSPFPVVGEDVDSDAGYYEPVGPINILSFLTAPDGLYTFNLVDAQFSNLSQNVYGNTEINLETNCLIGYPVCHRQGGNGKNVKFKTLYVDSQDSVNAHVRHGDTPGPCSTETP